MKKRQFITLLLMVMVITITGCQLSKKERVDIEELPLPEINLAGEKQEILEQYWKGETLGEENRNLYYKKMTEIQYIADKNCAVYEGPAGRVVLYDPKIFLNEKDEQYYLLGGNKIGSRKLQAYCVSSKTAFKEVAENMDIQSLVFEEIYGAKYQNKGTLVYTGEKLLFYHLGEVEESVYIGKTTVMKPNGTILVNDKQYMIDLTLDSTIFSNTEKQLYVMSTEKGFYCEKVDENVENCQFFTSSNNQMLVLYQKDGKNKNISFNKKNLEIIKDDKDIKLQAYLVSQKGKKWIWTYTAKQKGITYYWSPKEGIYFEKDNSSYTEKEGKYEDGILVFE